MIQYVKNTPQDLVPVKSLKVDIPRIRVGFAAALSQLVNPYKSCLKQMLENSKPKQAQPQRTYTIEMQKYQMPKKSTRTLDHRKSSTFELYVEPII